MRRIEFIGAPGTGKSTAHRFLLDAMGGHAVDAGRLYRREVAELCVRRFGLLSMRSLACRSHFVFRLLEPYLMPIVQEALENEFEDMHMLADLCLFQRPFSNSSITMKLNRTRWLVRDMGVDTILRRVHSQKFSVSEELLLQRGISLCVGAWDWEQFLKLFMEHTVPPETVILVTAAHDKIYERIKYRDGEKAHKMKIASELDMLSRWAFDKLRIEGRSRCVKVSNDGSVSELRKKMKDVAKAIA